MKNSDSAKLTPAASSRREVRRYLRVRPLLIALAIAAPFAVLGAWIWANVPIIWIGGAIVACSFGAFSAFSLMWLLNRAIFRRPYLLIDDSGVTHFPVSMPWRSTHVSWADIEDITISRLRNAGPSSQYNTTTSNLLVYTRHPERYAPSWRRRLANWWDPELQGATLEIGIEPSLAARTLLQEQIQRTFRRELAQYGVTVEGVTKG